MYEIKFPGRAFLPERKQSLQTLLPPELLELEPIPEIIKFQCPPHVDVQSMYLQLPNLLVPILLGQLAAHQHCFSQVIRLCADEEENVQICAGYPNVTLRCPTDRYRFILYLVDLVFLRGGRLASRHSEAVLVDTAFRTVEFFEPNGPMAQWYPGVTSLLETAFARLLPGFTFLATGDFCPAIGPQAISQLPICGSFSLLFLLLRVSNEEMASEEIVDLLVKLPRDTLIELMSRFVCYLNNYAMRNNIPMLQQLYEQLSDQLANDPTLLRDLDAAYFALNLVDLQRLARLYLW